MTRHSLPLQHTLQHTATHCNTLQHIALSCNTLQHTATHCNTLQHTATHCSTLQHTATHCSILQHTAAHCIPPVRELIDPPINSRVVRLNLTHCNTLQHTAAHCSTLQHTAAHCIPPVRELIDPPMNSRVVRLNLTLLFQKLHNHIGSLRQSPVRCDLTIQLLHTLDRLVVHKLRANFHKRLEYVCAPTRTPTCERKYVHFSDRICNVYPFCIHCVSRCLVYRFREIMVFIGKPKGRSMMISNIWMYFVCRV